VQLPYYLSSLIEPKDIANQLTKLQPHAYRFALAFLVYAGVNSILVVLAALLCVYVGPSATGSGIPEVKAYLNGVDTPNVFSFQTLIVKVRAFAPMPFFKNLAWVNACPYNAWLLYGVNKQNKVF
jgi:H+/Cl- antiporter ClcA